MRYEAVIMLAALALTAGPARAASPLKASYDDDFVLATEDKAFVLKIRGNIHFDVRTYQSDPRSGSPHAFDIRRARIDLQGTLFTFITFRLQPEFAGNPYIRNAWVDFGPLAWLHLRVGQMKVPFSSSWATLDNNVNFIERGASTPVYPFFDRGILLWGGLLDEVAIYNLGVFTGAGVDVDTGSGDLDDFKDLAGRLVLQPFRLCRVSALQGLYLVLQGTWGLMSVPTSRHDVGGLRSANFETAIWRWRTEQVIGSDGRVKDVVAASVEHRLRAGIELHYLLGPFALSAEYLEVHYRDITLYHDFHVGSSRRVHERLAQVSGAIRSLSVFTAVYLTGEHKRLTNWGWKTAKPLRPLGKGPGAWELLLRYSLTWSDENLFDGTRVAGYGPGDDALPDDYAGATPGAGNSVGAAVLDGAHLVHELSLGVNWALNPMVRIQINDVFLWAPGPGRADGGENKLVSGAKSNRSDPDLKYRKLRWENAVMLRLIFKL